MSISLLRRLGVAAIVFILCVLSILAVLGKTQEVLIYTGREKLQSASDDYLSHSFRRAVDGFAVVSVVKAALDVTESTDASVNVGVGGQLKIGDALTPVDDYVDILWATLITSCIIIEGLRFVLAGATVLGSCTLTLAALAGFALVVAARIRPRDLKVRRVLSDLLGIGAWTTLAMYYLIPLSILGASRLSDSITDSTHRKAENKFQELENIVSAGGGPQPSTWRQVKDAPVKVEHVFGYVESNGTALAECAFKDIAAYVFDCILFPFGLFLMLYRITRGVLIYVLIHRVSTSDRRI